LESSSGASLQVLRLVLFGPFCSDSSSKSV
jgi:hypothetical protein